MVFFYTLVNVIVLLPSQHQIVIAMLRQKLRYLLFLSLIILSSCSDLNDDLNINPNTFTTAPGYKLLQHSQLGVVNISSGEISRLVGIWTDQFQATDRGNLIGQYEFYPESYDSKWTSFYLGGCQNSYLAMNQAIESGHSLEEGIAKIMLAIYFGEAAALWGDIPCRESFNIHDYPNPKFDPQKQVFEDVQILLTEAIENLENAFVATAYGQPVFVPNEASWAEVAHSLKARYYLITKDYEQALIESKMGISSPKGNLLSAHRDEEGAKNLYYQLLVEQRQGFIGAANSHLVQLMTGETPRELITPGDAYRFNYYFQEGDYDLALNTSADGVFAPDASFPIISWIETRLIEAEASLRTGVGDALVPFNEVRDQLHLQYGDGFPHSASSGEQLLKQILEEKYISLIASLQTFHDLRRTKNLLEIPFIRRYGVENKIHPERFLYPQIEINTNSNFPGLIDIYKPTPVNQ